MYSNNILNFQESTTILNSGIKKKKAGNLLNASRIQVRIAYTWIQRHVVSIRYGIIQPIRRMFVK